MDTKEEILKELRIAENAMTKVVEQTEVKSVDYKSMIDILMNIRGWLYTWEKR